jgi:hypothetical protein
MRKETPMKTSLRMVRHALTALATVAFALTFN